MWESISGSGALGDVEVPAPTAHSIRGVGSSLTFFSNWSVGDVLKDATWRSNTVFDSFYLRDVSFILDECRSLGPFVFRGAGHRHTIIAMTSSDIVLFCIMCPVLVKGNFE